MERIDLYGRAHKALRANAFEAVVEVARTDFSSPEEAAGAVAAVQVVFRFFTEHARIEDLVAHPVAARLNAALASELAAEHTRLQGRQRELEGLLARIPAATDHERVSLGRRLHGELNLLLADHLHHMEREEREASRLFWAHLDDVALSVLLWKAGQAADPSLAASWTRALLTAVSLPERRALLAGLRRSLSPDTFETLAAPARAALGEAAWARANGAAS